MDCNSQGLNYNLCCNQVWEQMISVLWCWWEQCPWKLEPRESQMVPSTPLMGERSGAGRAAFALLCWTIMRANFFLHPLTQAHIHIFGGWHIWLSNLLFLWLTVGRGCWVIFMTKKLLFGSPFQLADEKQRHTAILNAHRAALSRDVFFLSFFCNKNSFSTEVYTFLENFYIYIYYSCYSSRINIDILYFSLSAGKTTQFEQPPQKNLKNELNRLNSSLKLRFP